MVVADAQGMVLGPLAGADSRGRVSQDEDGLFLVTYPHAASRAEFLLGLFESEEETKRVRDVLTIKEAVDEGRDLNTLRLFFTLHRYGVDNETVSEIRAVSFRQVVRDLQVCAIKPLRSPDDQQPTSWVAGGVSHHTNATTASTLQIVNAGAAHAPAAAFHAQQRPLAGARPGAGGQQPSPARSSRSLPASTSPLAVLPAVPAAGRPAAQAHNVQRPAPSLGHRRPVQPPPRFNQPVLPALPSLLQQSEPPPPPPQQQQQQGIERQQVLARQPPPEQQQQAPLPPPQQQQQQPQPQRQDSSGQSVEAAAPNGRAPGRGAGRQPNGVQGGGRKRQLADDSETSDDKLGSMRHLLDAVSNEVRGGALPNRSSSQPLSGDGLAVAGRGGGRAVKQRRGTASPTAVDGPGVRPWQGQDVLGFTAQQHPFHGITREGSGMAAQMTIRFNGSVPHAEGTTRRNIRFARCSGPAQAAVTWDLGAIWRALRYGNDPAELDAAPEANQALNFSFERYAPHLPALRAAQTEADVKELVRQLRDEPGRLESLATGRTMGSANGLAGGHAVAAAAEAAGGGKDSEEDGEASEPAAAAAVDAMDADPAPAAATAAALAAALGTAPAGTPAAAPAAASDEPGSRDGAAAAAAGAGAAPAAKGGRGRGRGRATKAAAAGGKVGRGSSGYKGVYGDGPWVAQVGLSSKRMLPERMQGWSSSREEQTVRVGACSSPALGATISDLLLLWRAKQYGEDVASVLLNFPLSIYAPFLPALDGVRLSGIQAHMNALRDGGSLEQVAEAGQQAQDGKGEQEEGPREQQEQQAGGGGAAAAAAGVPTAREHSPAAADQKAAAGPPAGRASVPAPTSAERQQEQRSRSQPAATGAAAAAAGAPPAGVAETSAAAAARAAAVAAAAPPVAPAQVLAAAEGVLQQLRNMTAAELQNAAYRPDERPQVQVAQAMYCEVQAALAATPQISELECVAYMAYFAQLRDLRSQLYREIMGWSAAGRHDLLAHHVRHMLPPRPAAHN